MELLRRTYGTLAINEPISCHQCIVPMEQMRRRILMNASDIRSGRSDTLVDTGRMEDFQRAVGTPQPIKVLH